MSTPAEIAAEAVDASYDAFGVAATYTPPGGGSPVPCLVIKDSSDRQLASGFGRPILEGTVLNVRKSEIATPVKGGVFVLSEGSFTIQGDPESKDAERLEWACIAS